MGRLRLAVDAGSLPAREAGMGAHLEGAVAARSAPSMAVDFFGIRRASEVARLSVEDAGVDVEVRVLAFKVNRQRQDQYDLG